MLERKMEGIQSPNWISPDLQKERGEIERVSLEVFQEQDTNKFFSQFLKASKEAKLIEISEDMWQQLENTDSFEISSQDWDTVRIHAEDEHPDHPRDWKYYKTIYEQGGTVETPTVVKRDDRLHLVAGNTRLMVARALGIKPKVLLVELH